MISELESKVPDGLCAATFFVSTGGDVVLSFAEWTSPEAHRRPMHDADFQQYVSIDDSRGRGGAPIHAGITSEREIGRYLLVANLEAELSGEGETRKASAG